MLEYVT